MGIKDLFTGRKKDSDCCGTQIVPEDDLAPSEHDQERDQETEDPKPATKTHFTAERTSGS